jgi:hypothetical protein
MNSDDDQASRNLGILMELPNLRVTGNANQQLLTLAITVCSLITRKQFIQQFG